MTASSVTVGIDVGGTKILAIALDEHGAPVGEPVRVATPRGGDALLDAIAAVVTTFDGVAAVGVGIPGLVDRSGTVRVGPNLPGVAELPVARLLQSRLDVPVVVDNDATCATWAESRVGAATGATEMLLVTLGTGIGGGIIAGGVLQRGANGFAGEPGHMVVDPKGPRCPCGSKGCWERYASGSGLGRLAREAAEAGRADRVVELAGGDPDDVRGEHVTRAAAEGDEGALAVMDELGWWAALGIANLVALLDPQVVVVGGGLVAAGELLLAPIRDAFPGIVFAADHRPPVGIVAAALGEQAGAVGAALLASAAR
ncbi:MAG: ROK family protein [Acidimicrobiales bacterium]